MKTDPSSMVGPMGLEMLNFGQKFPVDAGWLMCFNG